MEKKDVVDEEQVVQIDIRPALLAPVAQPLPADQHPALVYLASLAMGSRRTMAQALNTAAAVLTGGRCDLATMPWPMVRYQHTAAYRSWLLENVAASTGNKHMSALRGTIRECWRLGYMDSDSYLRAVDVKTITGSKPDAAEVGRAIEPGEFKAMLRICGADRTPAGPRDAAILGLGIVAGLRRAEIAALELRHYDGYKRSLTVRGKRNTTRIMPLAHGLQSALDDWLRLRGAEPGVLFHPVRKDGAILPGGITPAAIYSMLNRRAQQAGVAKFSPHDMRRTFIGDLLDAGADIVTVQKLAGHANVSTTARYDRRGERTRREAVGRLHMAWRWSGA